MGTSTKTSNPGGLIKRITALIAGTVKDIVGKVTVSSNAMTAAQIQTQLNGYVTTYGAVTNARVALKNALAAWLAVEPAARQFVTDYTHAIKAQFGSKSPQLLDFGINPVKPKSTRTAAQKAVSSALAGATKSLRGVKGSKQKAAITATGKPGLVLVDPSGKPLPTGLPGPTPPGQSDPVDAASQLAAALNGSSAAPSNVSPAAPGNGGSTDSSAAPGSSPTAGPGPSPGK